MTTYASSTAPSVVTGDLESQKIGIPSVMAYALAGAAPLTVVAGVITGAYGVTGILGIPLVFLVTSFILAIFAVGYVAMSRRITNAGAFYTYITHGLGRVPGVAASAVAVLAYQLLQVGLYGGFGAVAAGYTTDRFGWNLSWWAWAFIAWLLVMVLGLMKIRINSAVLAVLLVAEVVIAVVYDAVMLTHPAGGTVSFAALDPKLLLTTSISAAFVAAFTGFSGFESTVVLSEETRNPQKTIPRATYLTLASIAVLYSVSALALSVGAGPGAVASRAAAEGNELVFNLSAPYLAASVMDAGHLLLATSLFAALLAFHNTTARYLFSLGREGVIPTALGMVSPRSGAPLVASLTQSMSALMVIFLYAATGWDPFVHLFFWLGMTGGLGLLMLMVATSVAVVGYFLRLRRTELEKVFPSENVWRRLIAPLISVVTLGTILYFTVDQYENLLGVPAGSPAAILLPSSFAVAAAIGAAWALFLKYWRPDTYARIGLGTRAQVRENG